MYKDVWAAVVGEEFPCKREDGNRFDPFAVAVVRADAIIGSGRLSTGLRYLYNVAISRLAISSYGFDSCSKMTQCVQISNFRSLNFCIIRFHTNNAKICTIRKFPAIRYTILPDISQEVMHSLKNIYLFQEVCASWGILQINPRRCLWSAHAIGDKCYINPKL